MEKRLREAKQVYARLSGERSGNLKERVIKELSSSKEVSNQQIFSRPWFKVASTILVALILAGAFATYKGAEATIATALDQGRALSKQPTTPEQRRVWSLMFHAIEHFSTVQGVMLYHIFPMNTRVEFGEEVRPTAQGYALITDADTRELTSEWIVKDGYHLIIDPKTHSAQRLPWVTSDDQLPKNVPIPNNFGEADPVGLGIVQDLTNPHQFLDLLMNDFSNWHIDGTSTRFGRSVYDISGEFSFEKIGFKGVTSFTLVVDKDTGVILDVEFIGAEGQVIGYDKMESVTFNQPLQESKLNQSLPPVYKIVQTP